MDHGQGHSDDGVPAEGKGKGVGLMGKGAWSVIIDVHLTKGCPKPVFTIHSSLPKDGDNIVFKNERRPGFNIQFNLYDETGEGYAFPPESKKEEACWSQVGPNCPHEPVWEVFTPRHVLDHGKSLVVYNDNPTTSPGKGLGEFHYTLRVTNDGGDTYCELDPGGVDQNGQRQ